MKKTFKLKIYLFSQQWIWVPIENSYTVKETKNAVIKVMMFHFYIKWIEENLVGSYLFTQGIRFGSPYLILNVVLGWFLQWRNYWRIISSRYDENNGYLQLYVILKKKILKRKKISVWAKDLSSSPNLLQIIYNWSWFNQYVLYPASIWS